MEDLKVSVCSDMDDADAWIQREVFDPKLKVVGFDSEWTPRLRRLYGRKKVMRKLGKSPRPDDRTALIQIATPTAALLLRTKQIQAIPNRVRELVASPDIAKAGVEVRSDLIKFNRDFGVPYSGYVDLSLTAERLLNVHQLGLYPLASRVFGVELKKKSRAVQLSNWDHRDLSLNQVQYAALDAFLGVKIHRKLTGMGAYELDHELHFLHKMPDQQIDTVGLRGGNSLLGPALRAALESSPTSRRAREYLEDERNVQRLYGSYARAIAFLLGRIIAYDLSKAWMPDVERATIDRLISTMDSECERVGYNNEVLKASVSARFGFKSTLLDHLSAEMLSSPAETLAARHVEQDQHCIPIFRMIIENLRCFSDDSFVDLVRASRPKRAPGAVYKEFLSKPSSVAGGDWAMVMTEVDGDLPYEDMSEVSIDVARTERRQSEII